MEVKQDSFCNIKGVLAETIISEMFKAMGYTVIPFGMEKVLPELTALARKNQLPYTPATDLVRCMPDFIIAKDNRAFFIEVKFRADGVLQDSDFIKYDFYGDNLYIVLVSRKHIMVQSLDQLKEGNEFIYLGYHKAFKTDRETIYEYLGYVQQFLFNV